MRTRNLIAFAFFLLIALPAVSQTLLIETLAGSTAGGGYEDGRLSAPRAVAADAAGNLYVADTGNHAIRKITPGGVMTTMAGAPGDAGSRDGFGATARFRFPAGVAVDPTSGDIWVSDKDNHTIRKITPEGVVTTIAGEPGVAGTADAQGTAAKFGFPRGLVVDANGIAYVADTGNHIIRRVTPDGIATTFAGTPRLAGTTDGTGTAATFNQPSDIAIDPTTGNFYVVDFGSSRVRRITPAGVVTTVAGNFPGDRDDTGSAALFRNPWGLDVDGTGTVWIADHDNHKVRRMTPAGVVTTAAAANFPSSIAIGPGNTVYVAQTLNQAITRLSGSTLVTVAGSIPESGFTDGFRTDARFAWPSDVAVDAAGNVFVAQAGEVRKITPDGVTSSLRMGGLFAGLAFGPGGDLYITDFANDSVEIITADGRLNRFDVPAPWGIAVDDAGFMYVASDDHTIKLITPAGQVSTYAGGLIGYFDGPATNARFNTPRHLALDAARNLYVTDWGNNVVRKISPDGQVTTFASGFFGPNGIVSDAEGNLYVSDYNHVIHRVTKEGAVTTVAGLAGSPGNVDGVGARARFMYPEGLALNAAGQLIIADAYNHNIRIGTPYGGPTRRRPSRK